MALLRQGELSVTEVCFAVGCSSLGTFSTRFTELVGVPPSTYRQQSTGATSGIPPCVAKQVTRPVRNREAPAAGQRPTVTSMDISIHSTMLPHDDPEASLAFYRDTLGFEVRDDVKYGDLHWITVGPPGQPGTSIVLYPPQATPGLTDDERRTIAELMAKGTFASSTWPPTTSTARSSGSRPATPRWSRSRPTSRTASATAPSATPPATWSASRRCAEMAAIDSITLEVARRGRRRGVLRGRVRSRRPGAHACSDAPTDGLPQLHRLARRTAAEHRRQPGRQRPRRRRHGAEAAREELLGLRRRRPGARRRDLEAGHVHQEGQGPGDARGRRGRRCCSGSRTSRPASASTSTAAWR